MARWLKRLMKPVRALWPRRPRPPIAPRYKKLYRARTERSAIALWGFLNSQIGIGASARGYADALVRLAKRPLLYALPLPGRDGVPFPAMEPRRKALCNLIVLNPPELLDEHNYFPNSLMSATYRIGYWAWELAKVPEAWHPAYDLVDEIWTCSSFSAAALASVGGKPVRVLPHVVADWPHAAQAQARARLPALPQEGVLFLGVFDFASGLARKNPLGMIEAFIAAFGTGVEGPFLVLKYHSGHLFPEHEAAVRAAGARCPRIVFISDVLSPEEMHLLFDAVDCFVSLHRAEGFGLNIADAMMAGRPVICTAYSGNLDFTTDDTALLVTHQLVPVGEGEYYAWDGQVWAEPDIAAAAAAMRWVHDDPAFARALGVRAQAALRASHNADAITAQMRALLQATPGARGLKKGTRL